MKRPAHLEHTHERLCDWASWIIKHPHGIALLGVQVADLQAVRTNMPAKSLVPNDLMPSKIGVVDSIMHDPEMPFEHKKVIVYKYLAEPELSKNVSRGKHVKALEYMSGRLRSIIIDLRA